MATETWRSQNSFAGGVISEKMFGRVELEQYQDSLAELINFKVLPHGGITRRSGLRYVIEVKDSTKAVRVIPFEFSSDVSYVLEVGDQYIRFVKNGAQISVLEIATPYLEAEIFELKFVQSADTMWIVHPNHPPQKLQRFSDTEWYLSEVILIDGPYLPVNSSTVALSASGTTGSVTVSAATLATITGCVAYPIVNPFFVYNYIKVTTAAAHGLVSGDSAVISGVVGTTEANGTWPITKIDATNFYIEVTFANAYISGGVVDPLVFYATDVGRLIRMWDTGSAKWGWGDITAFGTGASVTVTINENVFPTAGTTTWRLGKFSATTGYPAAVMLYEQRLGYAAGPSNLQEIDFSQTGLFDWFQTAADETLLSTDALSWSLYSNAVDNIAWMLPGRGGLAIGTSGGAWVMTGSGGKDDPLTPSSVNARKHSAIGVENHVSPVAIDNAVVFVDKASRRIHEFAYLWEDDSYRAPDLTLLADHLLVDTSVEDMDVQGTKSIIWAVTGDGRLLGLTYMRSENVVAWHEHTTDGTFESVCAVTETRDEIPYFVVKRNVGGVDVRYIEFMEKDWDSTNLTLANYVDSGRVFNQAPSVTVSGLTHLEGETVVALADGKYVPPMVVSGGAVTLPVAASYGVVGLNFFSDVETLPIELTGLKSGSTVGRVKDIGKTAVRVTHSYGAQIGRTFDTLEEILFNENLVFGSAPELFSGEKVKDKIEGQPATDVRVCMRQAIPMPLTINSLVMYLLVTED